MRNSNLFKPYRLKNIELSNRVVMSPMTRCRAIGNTPNALMARYYSQRAGAGLIVTEGTSPSPNGLGYARIPGIYSEDQLKGWSKVTSAVHATNGRIFVQLMHTGRIGSSENLPDGAVLMAPSAVLAAGQIWTDSKGMVDHDVPKEMTAEELQSTMKEYVDAAVNAIEAGFDGVELHGANGYLLEQFLSPHSNQRSDEYGGSVENRCRFVLETAKATVEAIGPERVGIRLSPYGVASDMKPYPEIDEEYTYLASELDKLGIAYVHLVDHSPMGAPEVPQSIKDAVRKAFSGTLILAGGYDAERAASDIEANRGDLVAFGRPFIVNPDLVDRMKNGFPLETQIDPGVFYTATEKGYTDYPVSKHLELA